MNRPNPFTLVMRALYALSVKTGIIKVPDWPLWQMGMQFGIDEKTFEQPEAFQLLPDVYTAVSIIQDAIAALPLVFYEENADGTERIIERGENPVVDLFKRGNRLDTGYDMIHSLVGHYLISGNGALFLDYEDVNIANAKGAPNGALIPGGMWALPTYLIKPVLEGGRTIPAYLYYNGQSQPLVIPAKQVVWIPDFNTDDKGFGISRLLPLDLTSHTAYNMDRYQNQLLLRGGTVAGSYSSESALGPEERARVLEDLRVEGEGPDNFFKPVVLPRGLKFERAALAPTEMQFFDGAEWNTLKIARTFKIPPSFMGMRVGGLGASDKGLDADAVMLIRHALMPVTRRVENKLNERLFSELMGMTIKCRFDYSGEYALQQIFLDQAQASQTATGFPVVTVNEARRRLGLPEDPDARSDSLYVKDDAQAAQAAAALKAAPQGPPQGRAEEIPVEVILRDETEETRAMKRTVADHELHRWTEFCNVRVRALFKAQRERIGRALLEGKRSDETRAVDTDALAALLTTKTDIATARRMLREVFKNVGSDSTRDVAVDLAFSLLSKRSREWLDESSFEMVSNISDKTAALLREALSEGVGRGETVSELVSRVNEVFAERIARSAVIARTEAHAAINAGRLEGWRQAAEQTEDTLEVRKQWLTSHDELVRGKPDGPYKDSEFSHFHADKQTAAIDQPFFVGDRSKGHGESCMQPGDNSLSVGNRANCRCTMVLLVSNKQPDTISQKSLEMATSVEDILAR